MRLVAEVDGFVPHLQAPLDFSHREIQIPERHGADGHEAVGCYARPVDEPVVVGFDAFIHEVALADAQEVAVAEAAHIGIQHLRCDAFVIQMLHTGRSVPHGLVNLFVGSGMVGHHAVKACH